MPTKTNTELLTRPGNQIGGLERQRLYVLRQLSRPMACPNCAKPVTFYEAKGVTLDDLNVDESTGDNGTCPNCKRGLIYTVPMMGDSHWRLVPIDPKK